MSNPKIQKIRLAGTDYDLHVEKDWAQNDPQASDYIKNRTHYEDQNAIVFEGHSALAGNSVKLNFKLLPNTEYQYYADRYGLDPYDTIITTDENGDVSFAYAVHDIGFSIKGDTLTWTSTEPSSAGHFVKISGPTIKQLDPKYIPPVSELEGNVQANWNQPSELAPDYIKNKTHGINYIVKAEATAQNSSYEEDYYTGAPLGSDFMTTAWEMFLPGTYIDSMGNIEVVKPGEHDTEETDVSSLFNGLVFRDRADNASVDTKRAKFPYTLKLYQEDGVKQLDTKYIPVAEYAFDEDADGKLVPHAGGYGYKVDFNVGYFYSYDEFDYDQLPIDYKDGDYIFIPGIYTCDSDTAVLNETSYKLNFEPKDGSEAYQLFVRHLSKDAVDGVIFETSANAPGISSIEYTPLSGFKQFDAKYIPIDNETIITENGSIKTSTIHKGYTQGSAIIGNKSSTAGAKGFYIEGIDADHNIISLYTSAIKPTEEEYNGNWMTVWSSDIDFAETSGYSIGDQFTIYNGQSYPYCGTITGILGNEITYEGNVPSTFEIKKNEDGTPWRNWDADHIFYVPSKPDVGFVLSYNENGEHCEMWQNSTATGYKNQSSGEGTFIAGAENIAIDDHTAIFGRKNVGAYGSLISGAENKSTGIYNIVGGRKNTISGEKTNYNIVGGANNTVNSSYSFMSGAGNTDNGEYQNFIVGQANVINSGSRTAVFGENNTVAGDHKLIGGKWVADASDILFAIGNGKKGATSNAITVHSNGNTDISGTINVAKNVIGENNAQIKNNLWTTEGYIKSGSNLTATTYVLASGTNASGVGIEAAKGDIIASDGAMKAKDVLRSYTGLRLGGDNNVDIGGQDSLNIGVGTNINISAATKSIAVGDNLTVGGKGQFVLAENYYKQPETIEGRYNIVHGDTSNCQVTGNYNAVLCSGGNNTIKTQHNLVVGAGHTVDGILHETGEANLLVGVSHDINGANYSGLIGSGLTSSTNNQLVVGEYNTEDNTAAFIVGNGDKFGGAKHIGRITDKEILFHESYGTGRTFNLDGQDFNSIWFEVYLNTEPENVFEIRWFDNYHWVVYPQDPTYQFAWGYNPDDFSMFIETCSTDITVTQFKASYNDFSFDVEKDVEYYVAHFKNQWTNESLPEYSVHIRRDINGAWFLDPADAAYNYHSIQENGGKLTLSVDISYIQYLSGISAVYCDIYSVKPTRKNVFTITKTGETTINNKLTVNADITALGAANMKRINISDDRGTNDVSRENIVVGYNNTTVRGNGGNGSDHIRDSILVGRGLQGSGYYQMVLGQYNDATNDVIDAPLIIGWGDSDTARRTILTVNRDGRVTVGADPEEKMDLATKQYVDKLETRIKTLENIINNITTLGITKNDNGQLTITE